LPEYFTRTGFRVTPVVGLIQPPLELVPDSREVDEVFEVPLAFILDPANHRRATRELNGRTVGYYVIEHHGRTIWGATAGMLVNLCRSLGADSGAPQASTYDFTMQTTRSRDRQNGKRRTYAGK